MERCLNRIGKNTWPLAVTYAVPAESREMIVAFNFVSDKTSGSVYPIPFERFKHLKYFHEISYKHFTIRGNPNS
jgi:hypothetical protein